MAKPLWWLTLHASQIVSSLQPRQVFERKNTPRLLAQVWVVTAEYIDDNNRPYTRVESVWDSFAGAQAEANEAQDAVVGHWRVKATVTQCPVQQLYP